MTAKLINDESEEIHGNITLQYTLLKVAELHTGINSKRWAQLFMREFKALGSRF